jgi:molybdenum cofactor biosynthesis enzyme MoaA
MSTTTNTTATTIATAIPTIKNVTNGFNTGATQLMEMHQQLSEFMRYQSNIELPLAFDHFEGVDEATEEEKTNVEKMLKREQRLLRMIKALILAAEDQNSAIAKRWTHGDTETAWDGVEGWGTAAA